jgi:hypothetical protein
MRPRSLCSLVLLVGLSTCHERKTSEQTANGAARQRVTAAASSSAPAAPSTPAADSVTAAKATTSNVHCKARGSKGLVTLSPIPEAEVQLAAAGDDIYALGFTHELARTRLYRFTRQGGPIEVVAEQQGLGERKRFAVADGAAYYAQQGKLFKLGPAKGLAVVLRQGIDSPVAVVGKYVFAVACEPKGKADHLLQIQREGGAAETIADLPRASQERCQYSSLVADERDIFIADWNGSRIWGVSRVDKSARVVVAKRGFPGPLILETDVLVYASTRGLFRVARTGGAPALIADTNVALAPYSLIASSSAAYWVFDAIAYTEPTTLHRVPRAGGPSESVMVLTNADPNGEIHEGQGLLDFTLDEECVYVAQKQYKRPGTQIIVKALN